jgi:hypothetical protein
MEVLVDLMVERAVQQPLDLPEQPEVVPVIREVVGRRGGEVLGATVVLARGRF